MRLILASSSPRRRDLLARIGVSVDLAVSPDIDESPKTGELPRDYAVRLAVEKASAVPRPAGDIVVAGDTTIALGRRILPPAGDEGIQRHLLCLLSGRRHHALSAVCVIDGAGKVRTRLSDTIVAFQRLSDEEIDAYVRCGEGLEKAGGYAIQGRAEAFVRFMSGSHSGVVGLPLMETRRLLRAAGYPLD
ncbi:septum formation protein [Sphingomonas jejuensis]|uniref:dTTP/UTP pyrophosphatase n=1 Tax=Sphingomonas jejuensis TaxID=904715 RepID=A0ABX0XP78_9SPHN|nr:nucleoside triphosphate pyrophosphatase [Sphingomonas jejuensis]NJC34657.1 septum formation protein [Sphingomonas jejuensis]